MILSTETCHRRPPDSGRAVLRWSLRLAAGAVSLLALAPLAAAAKHAAAEAPAASATEAGHAITLTVREATSGKPAHRARIDVFDMSGALVRAQAQTNKQGIAIIDQLPLRKLRLQVSGMQGQIVNLVVDLSQGQPPSALDLVLKAVETPPKP